jgi:hypothetical protein
MHKSLLLAAIGAAISFGATAARAQLLYSFEPGDSPNGKDGFVDNGLFPSETTTGATVGSDALSLTEPDTLGGPTYNASYTTGDLPAALDNPNLVGFTADITISANAPYGGTYSDMGMGYYIGNTVENEFNGNQYIAPTSEWANIALAPGTYTSVYFPLNGTDPDNGNPESWSQMVSQGWVATGFNIAISNNAAQTVYVDNIQAVVPEPASLGALACTGGLMLVRRRRRI